MKNSVFRIEEALPIPTPRAVHAAGMVGGSVLVAGGSSWNEDRTVKQFRIDTTVCRDGVWSAGPDLLQPFVEGGYASDADGLYLAGGIVAADQPTAGVYRVASASGAFQIQSLRPLPAPVTACAAAIADRKLFLACGASNGQFTNQLLSLDLADPKAAWQTLPPLPGPARCHPAFTAIGNMLYLLGGLSAAGTSPSHALGDLYSYDPRSNAWTSLGDLPFAGYCWSASAISSAQLLLAGRADGEIHPEIYALDLHSLAAEVIGQAVIQATCAPLLQIDPATWWLISGEPDSKRSRTERVTAISRVL